MIGTMGAALLLAGGCTKTRTGPAATGSGALQSAPGGVVTSTTGERLELASLWKDRTAIVVFYRGDW